MKVKELRIEIEEYAYDELPSGDRELVDAAKKMTYASYVPYSHFHVGAAIRMADGSIVTGANQENAAYPSGTCAERSACYFAGANHPGVRMEAIAIAARTESGEFQRMPISPCGACRQALMEYEHRDGPMRVILYGADKTYVLPSVAALLPLSFTDF